MTAFDFVGISVDRLALRSRLLRLTPIEAYRQRRVLSRRAMFRRPEIAVPAARTALNAVARSGLALLPDAMALIGRGALVLDEVIARGPGAWDWHGRHLLESEDVLTQCPALHRLGLDEQLLDIAETYIGQPCFYLGCSLKREAVSPHRTGTRQWHLDIEDDRMLRLIVYLNDVAGGDAAFEYLDREETARARSLLRYRSGYVTDETMRAVVPEARWRRVTGPAGRVILFDGTRLFHRVARPTRVERFSLSITFSSRHPRQTMRPVRLLRASRRRLVYTLSERQRAALPKARWT